MKDPRIVDAHFYRGYRATGTFDQLILQEQVSLHLLPGRDLMAAMNENRQPLCSAADGRLVVEMIMAVFASHRQNGQRVLFPLSDRENPLAQWT